MAEIHPLAEARAQQESSDLKSKLSQIIYQGIVDRLKLGPVHADDLEPLFAPEVRTTCRRLVGAQFGSLASRGYIREKERRKSSVRSRKGAKSGVFEFTKKGWEKLVGAGGEERETGVVGAAFLGDSPCSGDGSEQADFGNSGLCECGCGEPAPISPVNHRRLGYVKGQPRRFVRGHATRKTDRQPDASEYRVEDQGFSTPCWIWLGAKDNDGYGRVRFEGKKEPAHRVYYRQIRGSIPPGHQLDHLCRVVSCVNPDHLEPVTLAENVRRGNSAKLTMEAAAQIRSSADSVANLARQFGVSEQAISDARNGRTWGDAPKLFGDDPPAAFDPFSEAA